MPCCLHLVDSKEIKMKIFISRKYEPATMAANNRTSIIKKPFNMKNGYPFVEIWITLSITQLLIVRSKPHQLL